MKSKNRKQCRVCQSRDCEQTSRFGFMDFDREVIDRQMGSREGDANRILVLL